jgi:hypothetical protein
MRSQQRSPPPLRGRVREGGPEARTQKSEVRKKFV